MPRMGALAGTVADVMEPIDQVLTIIPVMLRCEVATSHYILLFWYMLVYSFSNQKRTWSSEELEAGNDEVFVSIFFGYVFEFPGLDDQLLCLKMGKGSDNQNVCSLENGTMTWWATGCWQGETHPPASYSILQCDSHPRSFHFEDMFEQRLNMFHVFHVTIRTRVFVPVAFPKACRRRRRGSKWASPWGICWRTGETSWSMWCPWCPLLVSVEVGLWSLHGECPRLITWLISWVNICYNQGYLML
jgi:hypothetical protein